MKIRIALFIDTIDADTGGTERQVLETLKRLDRTSFEPLLICLYESEWMKKNPLPCETVSLGFKGFLSFHLFSVVKNLRALLRSRQIEILQTFFEETVFVAYLAARGMAKKPKLLFSRRDVGMNDEPWYHAFFDGLRPFILRRFDQAVVNAEGVRSFVNQVDKIPSERINVIYNGIDVANGNGASVPALFQEKPADVWLCLVANLNPVKRHDLFIHALAQLKKKRPDLNFKALLIGGAGPQGNEQEELARLASREGVSSDVVFAGAISNVKPYLKQVDVGVLCSDREGLSNSILEYMASSLPVVATAVGGNPELVNDANGFCVKPGDPSELARALEKLILDEKLRKQMGKESYKKVKDVFSWDRTIRETQDLYRNVVGN